MLTKGPDWIQAQVTSLGAQRPGDLGRGREPGPARGHRVRIVSVNMGRRLFRRLADLRRRRWRSRTNGCRALARLRDGEQIDVDAEAPAAESSADEIDQVQQAFNVMHRAAVAAAVDEANLRRGINEVFRNLARRSQRCCTASSACWTAWNDGRRSRAPRGPVPHRSPDHADAAARRGA